MKVFKIHNLAPPYLHMYGMFQYASAVYIAVLGEIPYDCLFQVFKQITDKDLCGFVVPLYGTTCPLL